MADVLVATEDLTVLGGPASISVDVDFGPTGQRGSNIYAVSGKPNDSGTFIPETPQIYDICINILGSSEEYMYMYQYINSGGTPTWVRIMNLTPNVYRYRTNALTPTDGVIDIVIPLVDITPLSSVANLTAANFNVQYSIVSDNPIASSMTISDIDIVGSTVSLPISIKGVEYASNAWVDMTGEKTVHLLITVV
jgi:hypothetical protein